MTGWRSRDEGFAVRLGRLALWAGMTLFGLVGPVMASPADRLVPAPLEATLSGERTPGRDRFVVYPPSRSGPVMKASVARFETRMKKAFALGDAGRAISVRIECACAPGSGFGLGEDEGYEVSITRSRVRIRATTEVGVMRAFATLFQLAQRDEAGLSWPLGDIRDEPRFAWRGLMIDVARHFQPIDALQRQIDAMEITKLNVLHLHLSDSEAFRVESRLYPRLHEVGSFGQFYSQAEIRRLVDYARERGVRIIPEFDLPGHSLAMIYAYPMLASAPVPDPPWSLPVRRNAVIDPTREEVYALLDDLIGEMTALFPDPHFHTGADEVNGIEWSASAPIAAFMKQKGFETPEDLQAYFSGRMHGIVSRHGKTMIGWDEILAPDLPKDVLVQSWTSSKMTGLAARAGHKVVVSAGYYLDWLTPSSFLHVRDPLDLTAQGVTPEGFARVRGSPLERLISERFVIDPSLRLSPEEEARILGGEAAMWTELVTPEKLDATIWPRAAAVADRLWSRPDAKIAPLDERLEAVSERLESAGLRHIASPRAMQARLAPEGGEVVGTLLEALEPVKFYALNHEARSGGRAPQQSFADLADALAPESLPARRFNRQVSEFLAGDQSLAMVLTEKLASWRDNDAAFQALLPRYPALKDAASASSDLARLSGAALEAMRRLTTPASSAGGREARIDELLRIHLAHQAASADALASFIRPQPPGDVLLAPFDGLRALVEAGG